jgi:hypothetical protein
MGHSAVEFVVVGFAGTEVDRRLATALREQVAKGTIVIIDLLFLQKDDEDRVRSFELDEVAHDGLYAEFNGIAQEVDGLISPEDVIEIADNMRPGTTAMFVLFEHAWLRDLRAAVAASGGEVIFAERIPGDVVDAVEAAASTA